ncbi:MAG: GLPGLI family protein [Arcicella sp.]|nr:GLPGLI family protein [Arcicella sp.]
MKKNYDVMGLEIGKSMSRFYSISLEETKKALMEQLKQTNGIDFKALKTPKNRRGKERIIFKNYGNSQITSMENLGLFEYTVQEPMPNISWQIQTDTMQIVGYLCQKAICQFKGRNYEAWFTSSINVSEGPWKFTGLPGLILKIIESKGHFIFECTAIEKVDTEIPIPVAKGEKVSKEQFLALNKLFIEDPLPFLSSGKGGTNFTIDNPPTNLPKRSYNPMELTEK